MTRYVMVCDGMTGLLVSLYGALRQPILKIKKGHYQGALVSPSFNTDVVHDSSVFQRAG